jgi:hypothetical protein
VGACIVAVSLIVAITITIITATTTTTTTITTTTTTNTTIIIIIIIIINIIVVNIIEQDIISVDCSIADVIFMFLVPSCLDYLSSNNLNTCKKGTRIVCYKFPLPGISTININISNISIIIIF